MLYSPSHDIGFAHYPKTGGTSLGAWFRSSFPDAAIVDPHEQYSVSHLPVRASLVRLGRATAPAQGFCNRSGQFLERTVRRLGAGRLLTHCPTRIIGVMREPFDTILSLFEYWRHHPFETEPSDPFLSLARTGTFPEFVHAAVIDRNLPKYEAFFDAYGPAWQTTRLIDFEHLNAGLAAVCREFRIVAPAPLQRLNARASRDRTLDQYRKDAGPLVEEVRRYFRWYYDNAARLMVCGDRRSG